MPILYDSLSRIKQMEGYRFEYFEKEVKVYSLTDLYLHFDIFYNESEEITLVKVMPGAYMGSDSLFWKFYYSKGKLSRKEEYITNNQPQRFTNYYWDEYGDMIKKFIIEPVSGSSYYRNYEYFHDKFESRKPRRDGLQQRIYELFADEERPLSNNHLIRYYDFYGRYGYMSIGEYSYDIVEGKVINWYDSNNEAVKHIKESYEYTCH